jgi:hypothetical protein
MNRWVIAAGLLASVTTGAQDPPAKKEYPKDGVYWASSWREAQDEALYRNAPLHIAFHKDDSDACLQMANSVYTDKKFIEASRMWVNVAAHRVTSHTVEVSIKGKKVQVCERYWNIPCAAHSMCFEPPKRKYGVLDEFPFRVFADPEGKEMSRELGAKTADELIKAMDWHMARVQGPQLSAAEWIQARAFRADAEKSFNEKEWPKAVEAYTRLSKFVSEKVRLLGEDGLDKVNKEGEQLYMEAIQLAQADDKKKVDEGIKLFKKIANEFKPLPVAKKADEKYKGYTRRK